MAVLLITVFILWGLWVAYNALPYPTRRDDSRHNSAQPHSRDFEASTSLEHPVVLVEIMDVQGLAHAA